MTRNESILQVAGRFCAEFFGCNYHQLEVNSWPRIASYYVARQLVDVDADIFASLREISRAVHKYNRNITNTNRGMLQREPHQAASLISEIGITVAPGGSRFERITGEQPPEGHVDKRGANAEVGEPLDEGE